MSDDMPNGDCSCASDVPFRHLDANGHLPSCANWTWEMLWHERLGRNLAVAGALCEAFDIGMDQMALHGSYHMHGYRMDSHWRPGCGRSAP